MLPEVLAPPEDEPDPEDPELEEPDEEPEPVEPDEPEDDPEDEPDEEPELDEPDDEPELDVPEEEPEFEVFDDEFELVSDPRVVPQPAVIKVIAARNSSGAQFNPRRTPQLVGISIFVGITRRRLCGLVYRVDCHGCVRLATTERRNIFRPVGTCTHDQGC